ncbi:hypothetical protein MJ563_17710 [Klebsiella pneumoniae]|nr:hypothetical protein MJ563_17710 [Klebsiella pneumoniae]
MAIFQFIAVIAMIPLCIRCFGPAPSYRMVVVPFGPSSLPGRALLYYAGPSDVYSFIAAHLCRRRTGDAAG